MCKHLQFLVVALVGAALVSCSGGTGGGSEEDAAPQAQAENVAGSGGESTPAATKVASGTATIKGSVTFKGTPPERIPLKQINTVADCKKLHAGSELPLSEQVIVGPNAALKNVLLFVSKGVEGQKFPVPTEPVVFDQKGCQYNPHVFAVQAGQKFSIVNSDPLLHNVHMFPTKNPQFNRGQPSPEVKFEHSFRRPEPTPVKVKCDVHPWMNAWVGVFSHPFFGVSGDDGAFELPKIAPGTYTVTAWHEKYGSKTQDVTVADGDTKEITFEFEGK